MVQTIQGAEKIYNYDRCDSFVPQDATDSINSGKSVSLCKDIDAWGLLCLSTSGYVC
ncbi:MAG: hypothetical protein Q9M40_13390 [Sulfurimonas sp.]|nr:hypothetical protein [Sulfurimonas sp.]